MSEKTSRSSYTAKFKLVVIKHAEENGNRAASRKFDVPETNVRDWRKQKAKLSVTTRDRRSFRGKKAMYPDVETQLVEFVQEKRSGAFSVTTEMIQIQARRIAERLNIDTTQFRASLGWCIRFLRRHGLSIRRRTTLAQRLPDEYENKIIEFHQYILQVRGTSIISICIKLGTLTNVLYFGICRWLLRLNKREPSLYRSDQQVMRNNDAQ